MVGIGRLYVQAPAAAGYNRVDMDHQLPVSNSVDRVIHIPLSEAEWQAFLASTPKPVDWLRERIREAINKSQSPSPKPQIPTA
jgi:hypothetical protein